MYSIDVKTEVRKIANSKPVHAAAGAGVLATQALRELPGRLVRTIDGTVNSLPSRASETVTSLPGRASSTVTSLPAKATETVTSLPGRASSTVTSLPARATEYVQTARAKAADGYDKLADHGKRALNGQDSEPAKSALNGTANTSRTRKPSASRTRTSKTSTASKSK
jgi:hypothetical protein